MNRQPIIQGILLNEEQPLSLVKLCQYCAIDESQLIKMVNRGMIEPNNFNEAPNCWTFKPTSLLRVKTVQRLQKDLELNLAGAVLALELLDEIKQLRQQVAYLRQ